MERVEYSFHTRVLDGGCGRGYCTANIDTELGIWTITGGTGAAAGRFRGGQFRTRGGRVDVPSRTAPVTYLPAAPIGLFTHLILRQTTAASAGGQLINW